LGDLSARLAADVRECREKHFVDGFSLSGNWNRFALQECLREVPMPVYDYICKDCQNSFELVLTLSEHDKENIRCPISAVFALLRICSTATPVYNI
jgi:putative FmdB family regulatory protein